MQKGKCGWQASVACVWEAAAAHQESSARDAETRLVANEGDALVRPRRPPGIGSDHAPILVKQLPEPDQAQTQAPPPRPRGRQTAGRHRAKGLGDCPVRAADALSAGVSTR